MIKLIMAVIMGCLLCSFSIMAQNLLDRPESILFDEAHNRYLVSNMNAGYVVQIDHHGSYSVFCGEGILSSSFGMHIIGDTLFVASDFSATNQGVAMFDLNTAEHLGTLHPAGMIFANDITADPDGSIYVTDTQTGRIYKIDPATGIASTLAINLGYTNGIHYDAVNNRLLTVANAYLPLMAVDIVTGAVTAASPFYSVYDGFGEDRRHNLYVSDSDLGVVFRFDSTLSVERVVISEGHNVPEGIDFNILHSTLAIPNMFAHTVDLIPLDVDLWSSFDTTFGWAPLEVSLSAGSDYDVAEWIWDFGDGDSTTGQSPSHLYVDAGYYDVTLCAVTVAGDSVKRVYPGHISILADSVWAEDVEVGEDGLIEVVVHGTNNVPLKELRLPVGYSGWVELVYDSFSTHGCRTEFFEDQEEVDLDSQNQDVSFRLRTRPNGSPLFLPPGSGPILKAYFHLSDHPSSQETELSFDPSGAYYAPAFEVTSHSFKPGLRPPWITLASCCGAFTGGYAGNIDCSDDGKRNLADITRLIDRVYISKTILCCEENGNVDGDVESKVNLADITRLIDHVYISKTETAICI